MMWDGDIEHFYGIISTAYTSNNHEVFIIGVSWLLEALHSRYDRGDLNAPAFMKFYKLSEEVGNVWN